MVEVDAGRLAFVEETLGGETGAGDDALGAAEDALSPAPIAQPATNITKQDQALYLIVFLQRADAPFKHASRENWEGALRKSAFTDAAPRRGTRA